jgi:CRISPR-associated endonuclease/helicase Cas3
MDRSPLYAHSPGAGGTWHELKDHLIQVAKLATVFASSFHMEGYACLAGLFHDLGKAFPEFQRYLQAQVSETYCQTFPHSPWGAALAFQLLGNQKGWDIVLPVAGHHAGLPERGLLSYRLQEILRKDPGRIKKLHNYLPCSAIIPSPGKIPALVWITKCFQILVEST